MGILFLSASSVHFLSEEHRVTGTMRNDKPQIPVTFPNVKQNRYVL